MSASSASGFHIGRFSCVTCVSGEVILLGTVTAATFTPSIRSKLSPKSIPSIPPGEMSQKRFSIWIQYSIVAMASSPQLVITSKCLERPPLVIHVVVGTSDENVDPVWPPGNDPWLVVEDASELVPSAPRACVVMHHRLVDPLVPERVIAAFGEAIQPIRPPRGSARTRSQRAAQILPAVPTATVPPFVPHVVVHAAREAIDSVGSP